LQIVAKWDAGSSGFPDRDDASVDVPVESIHGAEDHFGTPPASSMITNT